MSLDLGERYEGLVTIDRALCGRYGMGRVVERDGVCTIQWMAGAVTFTLHELRAVAILRGKT